MKILLNILWFIFIGLASGAVWLMSGIILCFTLIGIPFGIQCFKLAFLTFAPFGKDVYCNFNAKPISNTIWVILIGWILALMYLCSSIVLCITIIGIPCAIQSFKMMKLALLPFGAEIIKKR